MESQLAGAPAPAPFGLPVLAQPVPLAPATLDLVRRGIAQLWSRIVAADPRADERPLLLSYDVHPAPDGPVLIEVNTNAGGIATAMQAAREINTCCADWERDVLEARLLALFQRDLLGEDPDRTGVVAIVDDALASQPLLPEMHALAELMRRRARQVLVIDASELAYADGRLRHGAVAIDRIYWRSTDFLVAEPGHAAIRRALEEGTTVLAPSPQAYAAIADKRRFLDWSTQPELARDADSGQVFRVAQTLPMTARSADEWHADRAEWVFKPASGHASRGVYVGKSISRHKLAELPFESYLAQRYAPHPVVDRDGRAWKYDIRFYADRGTVIGAAARVFQGQVVGMRGPGAGFAPVRVGDRCCLVSALGR
jgi:glutathione synthase/RimK-type ligase-like ATP-grasp enzyme